MICQRDEERADGGSGLVRVDLLQLADNPVALCIECASAVKQCLLRLLIGIGQVGFLHIAKIDQLLDLADGVDEAIHVAPMLLVGAHCVGKGLCILGSIIAVPSHQREELECPGVNAGIVDRGNAVCLDRFAVSKERVPCGGDFGDAGCGQHVLVVEHIHTAAGCNREIVKLAIEQVAGGTQIGIAVEIGIVVCRQVNKVVGDGQTGVGVGHRLEVEDIRHVLAAGVANLNHLLALIAVRHFFQNELCADFFGVGVDIVNCCKQTVRLVGGLEHQRQLRQLRCRLRGRGVLGFGFRLCICRIRSGGIRRAGSSFLRCAGCKGQQHGQRQKHAKNFLHLFHFWFSFSFVRSLWLFLL